MRAIVLAWKQQIAWLKRHELSDEAIGKAIAGLERAERRLEAIARRKAE